jgi:flavin-dependent dehydrogenase
MSKAVYDVVVLGGGLAGLTIAIQLKRAIAVPNVLVLEHDKHPVREAAHKVGESTVEIGARYYAEIVGMKQHLETRHLRKMGLRYFFPANSNREIRSRLEVGPADLPAVPTYQIDRGRFENELADQVNREGAEFRDEVAVQQVALGPDLHTVTFTDGNHQETSVRTRWVVDASGRSSILKRQLKLGRSNGHDVNAAWWRIGESVAVDDWSEDSEWQARVPSRKRFLGTNHLMGEGYWVWLIPLASNSTSFGIVADPALHPFEEINTFERSLHWLWRHEPQCAAIVEQRRHKLQDFRVMKHFSHDCSRVFSADRWGLSGDAGVFLDPFYSPGSDFIAISNTYITDLIARDLHGEDIQQRAEYYNTQFLSLFHNFLLTFKDRYPIMGNAQVMTAKLVWDTATYWSGLAFLYFHDKLCDLEFMQSIRNHLLHFGYLNLKMQEFFGEWHALERSESQNAFVNLQRMDFLSDIYRGLTARLDDPGLEARLSRNLELLEIFAAHIVETVRKKMPGHARLAFLEKKRHSDDLEAGGMDRIWLSRAEVAAGF